MVAFYARKGNWRVTVKRPRNGANRRGLSPHWVFSPHVGGNAAVTQGKRRAIKEKETGIATSLLEKKLYPCFGNR